MTTDVEISSFQAAVSSTRLSWWLCHVNDSVSAFQATRHAQLTECPQEPCRRPQLLFILLVYQSKPKSRAGGKASATGEFRYQLLIHKEQKKVWTCPYILNCKALTWLIKITTVSSNLGHQVLKGGYNQHLSPGNNFVCVSCPAHLSSLIFNYPEAPRFLLLSHYQNITHSHLLFSLLVRLPLTLPASPTSWQLSTF